MTTAVSRGEVVWAQGLREPKGEAKEGCGSTVVWGVGVGSKRGLKKTKMPKSGLFQLVSKHASWFFFFINNLTKKTIWLGSSE